MKRSGERGFSLLEVLFASALTIGVILATTSAVLNAMHASTISEQHMGLNDDALSAINDVRAISAYDPAMFKAISGRTSTMTRPEPPGPETITVSVQPIGGSQNLLATATVIQGNITVVQTQTLFQEAPIPGSIVTPAPSATP